MIATKSEKLKMALTSTPMILLYVIVVFCVVAAIRQPAFISPATAINLARAGIFTMCFAICEMVVILPGHRLRSHVCAHVFELPRHGTG